IGVEVDPVVCAVGDGVCAATAVNDAPSRTARVVVMRRRSLMRSSLLSARNRVSKSSARDNSTAGSAHRVGNAEPARGERTNYGVQVAAIIFTLSTFNVGAAVAALAEALGGSTVPLISTLCPTCGVSLLSSAESL